MKNAKKFGPKNGGSYIATATERWDQAPPDWIIALARAADRASNLGALAKELDLKSSALISAVIGNTYKGRMGDIAAKVRGKFMSVTVECPVLGKIGRDACAGYQKRKFSASSPQAVRLHRACASCANRVEG